MKNKGFKIAACLLFIIPLVSMSFKVKPMMEAYKKFNPEKTFEVCYEFDLNSSKEKSFVKAYLPQSNVHQNIFNVKDHSNGIGYKEESIGKNKRGIWETNKGPGFYKIRYKFKCETRAIEYKIDPKLSKYIPFSKKDTLFLKEEEYIQAHHPKIDSLAFLLTKEKKSLNGTLDKIYQYVYKIPAIRTSKLTDALTTLEENKASCNGKARLFVALCRNISIPARLKGGLILENNKKRTSHLWAEVLIENTWVPFDALNGYYAKIPANYLELYEGDLFLLAHSSKIAFDYKYNIKEESTGLFINETFKKALNNNPITLFKLNDLDEYNQRVIYLLLLFPLGGLMVAIFNNVIGFKTFGVFLPVLIAFSFLDTGFWCGLFLFIAVLIIVSLITLLLDKWNLLYVPKMAFVLSALLLVVVVFIYIGIENSIPYLTKVSMFPFVIIAVVTERFSTSLAEKGYVGSLKTLGHTLIVTTVCYLVFASSIWKAIAILFPETILLIMLISLLLGKWIGMRLTEYKRFNLILK
jgi:transglutaminase-like putative cysteine protease